MQPLLSAFESSLTPFVVPPPFFAALELLFFETPPLSFYSLQASYPAYSIKAKRHKMEYNSSCHTVNNAKHTSLISIVTVNQSMQLPKARKKSLFSANTEENKLGDFEQAKNQSKV